MIDQKEFRLGNLVLLYNNSIVEIKSIPKLELGTLYVVKNGCT